MNDRYQSLSALLIINNCTNLALLKKQLYCIFYHGTCCINNKNSLKIFLAQKFKVLMTALLSTLSSKLHTKIFFSNTLLFNVYKKVLNFFLMLKQAHCKSYPHFFGKRE